MIDQAKAFVEYVMDAKEQYGVWGSAQRAANQLLVRKASLSFVHTFLLDEEGMRFSGTDSSFTTRFLTPAEVRHFGADPVNGLTPEFVDRAEAGLDLCYAAFHGDRLASYGWYALHSIEAEHAAGAALGLPHNIAYTYKGYTHPDFRGRRLYGACMGRALEGLKARGVEKLLAFVYWHNAPSLRSFEHLGYRKLGILVVGPDGPTHVPREARRLGLLFGDDARAALARRYDRPRAPIAPLTRPTPGGSRQPSVMVPAPSPRHQPGPQGSAP